MNQRRGCGPGLLSHDMLLLFIPEWLTTDSGKLVALTLALVALFVVMRIVSRRSTSNYEFPGPDAVTRADTGAATTLHPEMQFEKLRLRKFYMREFDVMTGPPDPFEFVDELTAEIEHVDTGERSTWEFTVGTPAGFARLLERKDWESFYSPQVFVIRKYELEMVRAMIMEHISEVIENRPSQPTPGSMDPHRT